MVADGGQNFLGAGVNILDGGGGKAVVTIPGAAASPGFVAQCVPGTDDFSMLQAPGLVTCKWSNVIFDTDGAYVPGTGIYTFPEDGKYAVFGVIDAIGNASANYAALACIPGTNTDLSVIHGFARSGVTGMISTPVLFSIAQFAAGQQIKFVRYYFGGSVTLVNNAVLPASLNGVLRLSD